MSDNSSSGCLFRDFRNMDMHLDTEWQYVVPPDPRTLFREWSNNVQSARGYSLRPNLPYCHFPNETSCGICRRHLRLILTLAHE